MLLTIVPVFVRKPQACFSALADHLSVEDKTPCNKDHNASSNRANGSEQETHSEQHIIRHTNGNSTGNFLGKDESYSAGVTEEKSCDMEAVVKGEKELRFAARAVSLVRKMGKAGVRLRPETAALAQQVCALAGRMGAVIEIRQALEEQEAERRDKEMSVGGGRWRLREKPQRTLARY